jgi:hypothetical protein
MNKIKHKTTISPEERSRRRTEIGKAASKKIAKSEQLNFRIEEQVIKDLQELAYSQGLPVSTMIHDWVLERLVQEKFGKPEITAQSLQLLNELHIKLQNLFGSSVYQQANMKVAEGHSQYKPKSSIKQ